MAPFLRFDKGASCDQLSEARRKADRAIGGATDECEIGWKVGVTRAFMRAMEENGGYLFRGHPA